MRNPLLAVLVLGIMPVRLDLPNPECPRSFRTATVGERQGGPLARPSSLIDRARAADGYGKLRLRFEGNEEAPSAGAGSRAADAPADLRSAYRNARYRLEPAAYGGVRGDNDANGFSVRFSGAEETIDSHHGARAVLTLKDYGWGSALSTAGPVTRFEASGNRLDRHYTAGLAEWFLNTPEGLEQGFTIASRGSQQRGRLRIRLGLAGGWTVDGGGDRVRLNSGAVTLDYAGLRASDASGEALPASLRASGEGIEIEVDDTGAIYPLAIDPTLTQQQELTASDGLSGDQFGWSVALSSDGNTALVGADRNSQQGAAYVFTRSGTTWTWQQKLTASDAASGDYFGNSVALSSDGNTALVGAFQKYYQQGAAYVFTRSGATWTQQQKLTAPDAANDNYFGNSVALSSDGNTALAGADGWNSGQGAAYAFTRSGATWILQQELTASGYPSDDEFGYSVALSGDGNTALAGAIYTSGYQGAAYAFSRSGTTWTQQQKFIASDAVNGDYLGYSVALSVDGNTALAGAPEKNGEVGAIYAFTRSGTTWTQQQELTASDAASLDQLGISVGLSGDGNTALAGAFTKNNNQGAAYAFTRSGAAWTQQQKLTASDGAFPDHFGRTVALSADGNTALAGAPNRNSSQGVAYAFTAPPVLAPPTARKGFNPGTIQSGGNSLVTVTLSNSNASGLTGGAFTDTLVNMSAAGGAVGGTCAGVNPASLTAGVTALSFSAIAIPAASSCTVTFYVSSTVAGANPNTTSGVTAAQTAVGAPSNTASLTVLGLTSTTLSLSPNPANFGQSVTLTATVTPNPPASATPTGTVMFFDGLTLIGTATLNSGVAAFNTSTLSMGAHAITASYGGDSLSEPSVSSGTNETITGFMPVVIAITESITLTDTPGVMVGPAPAVIVISESIQVNDAPSPMAGPAPAVITVTESIRVGDLPAVSACATDDTSQFTAVRSGFRLNTTTHQYQQTVQLTNKTTQTLNGPFAFVVDALSATSTLFSPAGTTSCAAPSGSPYLTIPPPSGSNWNPGQSVTVGLNFVDPSNAGITYNLRVLAGTPIR